MAIQMITLHAYGTWMPDHTDGFMHRTLGLLPKNRGLAGAYRANQAEATVYLNGHLQQMLIESALDALTYLDGVAQTIATEPTHFHLLFSWSTERRGEDIARSIRVRFSRDLNQQFGRRENWWTAKGKLSRVKDDEHLSYLRRTYLPDHRGWK